MADNLLLALYSTLLNIKAKVHTNPKMAEDYINEAVKLLNFIIMEES